MRYILDTSNWNQTSGPILFYAGNEGGIWNFYNNSGFMTETLAKELQALVVFGEHRYYGESLPFGQDSYKNENLKYFSVEQVFQDYVALLDFVKDTYDAQDRAVIAFGGSYGGMLAAWMRMKYPT